jgi:hypothetical protein
MMIALLQALARPWRSARKVVGLPRALLTHLRQMLDLQRTVTAEVRELHASTLLAAIHLIEEQRRAREDLARDCARLERRLDALEQRLPAAPPSAPSAGE